MAAKKKAAKKQAKKSRRKATKSPGYFVFVPAHSDETFHDKKAELSGPHTAAAALSVVEEKVENGCDRKEIQVLSGRKAKIEIKIK